MKKKVSDGTSVNSILVRRPIQRWFPLLVLPTFVCFCVGFIWPFLQGLYLSLCNFMTPRDAKFVGFENSIKAFEDASFAHAFWNTAGFAAGVPCAWILETTVRADSLTPVWGL